MPYKKSKYSKEQNSEITFNVLDVLLETRKAMSISDIKAQRPSLANITTQKMARILTELNEKNLVRKGKSKGQAHMMYKATAVMAEEGYDVNEPQEDY